MPRIESISQLLTEVAGLKNEWEREDTAVVTPWFRGHGCVDWSLTPGAYRDVYQTLGQHRYLREFRLRAHPFLSEVHVAPVSDWDWYLLMQHYGVPTRLLDWTESALVALYFSCREREHEEVDGAVCILHPGRLNASLGPFGARVPEYSETGIASYVSDISAEGGSPDVPEAPLAFDPPHHSRRLVAQRGKFTIHGSKEDALDALSESRTFARKLSVHSGYKAAIRAELRLAGLTESVIFPSLAGLGREIRQCFE